MNSNKKTLFVLTAIMLVNALSYGTIIPLLYPYASRFGLDPFGLSLLFTSYSFFQFLATPIIGRLSDRYGRRPLLLLSIFGTAISLALFAGAWSLPLLFLARILDGITGGNMSVAQAVIADTTTGQERAKGFGMLGASFGFGFLIGPALGGLLSAISLTAPFWFAAGLASIATLMTAVFLPETVQVNKQTIRSEPLFDIKGLFTAFSTPIVGVLLVFTLLTALALNMFIIGFQTFTVDVLLLSSVQIGLLFTLTGLVNIIVQAFGVGWLLKKFKSKRKVLAGSALAAAILMLLMSGAQTFVLFLPVVLAYMFAQGPLMPLVSGVISERTAPEDQGAVLGINQSYLSIGQIVGPLIAGLIASRSVSMVFLAASLIIFGAWLVLLQLKPRKSASEVLDV
ncbi:MFS transporter [Candidatus Woesebacteria bacterium]|nr:MFS transporter [Candidatus Woesebacteria bacterium]